MTTALVSTDPDTELPTLTVNDYCDRCPSTRAIAVVLISGMPLYFCRYHLRKSLPAIEDKGYPVYSELDIEKEVLFH